MIRITFYEDAEDRMSGIVSTATGWWNMNIRNQRNEPLFVEERKGSFFLDPAEVLTAEGVE